MTEAPVRVMVADDHTLLREGLRELLLTDPGFVVVADAATGPQVIARTAEHQPDLLLLDVQMPGPGAKTVVEQVRAASPNTKIIILTMHDDPALVRRGEGHLARRVVRLASTRRSAYPA